MNDDDYDLLKNATPEALQDIKDSVFNYLNKLSIEDMTIVDQSTTATTTTTTHVHSGSSVTTGSYTTTGGSYGVSLQPTWSFGGITQSGTIGVTSGQSVFIDVMDEPDIKDDVILKLENQISDLEEFLEKIFDTLDSTLDQDEIDKDELEDNVDELYKFYENYQRVKAEREKKIKELEDERKALLKNGEIETDREPDYSAKAYTKRMSQLQKGP